MNREIVWSYGVIFIIVEWGILQNALIFRVTIFGLMILALLRHNWLEYLSLSVRDVRPKISRRSLFWDLEHSPSILILFFVSRFFELSAWLLRKQRWLLFVLCEIPCHLLGQLLHHSSPLLPILHSILHSPYILVLIRVITLRYGFFFHVLVRNLRRVLIFFVNSLIHVFRFDSAFSFQFLTRTNIPPFLIFLNWFQLSPLCTPHASLSLIVTSQPASSFPEIQSALLLRWRWLLETVSSVLQAKRGLETAVQTRYLQTLELLVLFIIVLN